MDYENVLVREKAREKMVASNGRENQLFETNH